MVRDHCTIQVWTGVVGKNTKTYVEGSEGTWPMTCLLGLGFLTCVMDIDPTPGLKVPGRSERGTAEGSALAPGAAVLGEAGPAGGARSGSGRKRSGAEA